MTNTNNNDIDALLRELAQEAHRYLDETKHSRRHAALTALIAERDSLREEIAAAYRDRASSKSVLANVIAERDALQSKIDSMNEAMHSIARRQVALEEEAEERQSIGLRERLVCAALTGILANYESRNHGADDVAEWAVLQADATIAAMRKGDSDGK